MSAEWKQIGSIEVCEGTDGATGVFMGSNKLNILYPSGEITFLPGWSALSRAEQKERFEAKHCKPIAPTYIRRDYADGSVVLESVARDEIDRPLRSWQVWQDGTGSWRYFGASCGSKDEAIRMAIESADAEAAEAAEKSQPRHRLIECADGAVMVLSVDEVDGKPRRGASVLEYDNSWWCDFTMCHSKHEAIAAAVAYVTAR